MRKTALSLYRCPECGGELNIQRAPASRADSEDETSEGAVTCDSCTASYPIENCIPRFVASDNYASSFALEWRRHARTQIDKFNGTTISRDRFFQVTKWSEDLADQRVLEAGCGAGRFTQIALESGAEVYAFDYSSAVDVNLANNIQHNGLNLLQADIYRIPLRPESFDKVFCFGTLQHCPDVKGAFFSLLPCLKSGGDIAIDVYKRSATTRLSPKYLLRPLTSRVPHHTLYPIVKKVVPLLLPIKRWCRERIPFLGRYLGGMIPVVDYKGQYSLTNEQLVEWGTLDTFDTLSPKYDNPQRLEDVRDWFLEAGLVDVEVEYGPNGVNARGKKP